MDLITIKLTTIMKKTILTNIILFVVLTIAVQAQQAYQVNVSNLVNNPNTFLNNEVVIEGIIDRHLTGSTAAGFLYLRDDYGDIVRVRVLEDLPEVNRRARIRGVYTREIPANITANFIQRYYIDARRINILDRQTPIVEPPTRRTISIESEPSGAEILINGRLSGSTPFTDLVEEGTYSVSVQKNLYEPHTMTLRVQGGDIRRTVELERGSSFYGLIAGSGLLLLLIIGGVFLAVGKKDKKDDLYIGRDTGAPSSGKSNQAASSVNPPTVKMDKPAPQFATPSTATVENKTVKINMPKDHTIKVLDEYFDVLEGLSEVQKIHLYQSPDKQNSEYTFGRNSGTEYSHIQLKSPAVSRNQAKLIVMKDGYVLINYAKGASNPTRINDMEMAENESVNLNMNDIITMGDVKLRFTSKRG